MMEAANQWLQTVLADIDNIDRLTQQLGPLPSDLRKNFDDVKKEAAQLKELLNPKGDIWDDEKAVDDTTTNIDDKSTTLSESLEDARKQFTAYADRVRKEKQQSLKCWTFGSNVLFVVGWMGVLIGKFYGEEKDEGAMPGS